MRALRGGLLLLRVMGKRRPHTLQKGRYSVIIPPFLEVPLMNIK
jgi:hypothetical protein